MSVNAHRLGVNSDRPGRGEAPAPAPDRFPPERRGKRGGRRAAIMVDVDSNPPGGD
ncbi:hypothetical protein WME99_15260 [Sorangium sp. So ce136]|uniref:hypothetical protein n=1 Tax=Sorangium sp. So ce136 TaxID=3133284 RepID=UPI003EFC7AB3